MCASSRTQQDTSKAARAELRRALPQPFADDLVVAASRVLGPAAVAAARDAEGDLAHAQQRELLTRLLAERARARQPRAGPARPRICRTAHGCGLPRAQSRQAACGSAHRRLRGPPAAGGQ
jgi:hypothetical protein